MNYIKRLREIRKKFGYDNSLYSDPKGFEPHEYLNAGNPDACVIYRHISNASWRHVILRVPWQKSTLEDLRLTDKEAEYLLSEVATKEEFEARLMAFAVIKKVENDNGL